jgi:hypothetical protein
MVSAPVVTERVCVGCMLSVSACTCKRLAGPVEGSEHVPVCRCGRLTSAPHVRTMAALGQGAVNPFEAALARAVEVAEQGVSALEELAELTAPPNVGGGVFAVLLSGAQARAVRQREILKSLLAVVKNPGARIVLENGRPVVHLAEPVTVEELGAAELDAIEPTEIRTVPPPPPVELADELPRELEAVLDLDTYTEARSSLCALCGREVKGNECTNCGQHPTRCICALIPGWPGQGVRS